VNLPLLFSSILLVASWLGRSQGEAIDYLRAENSVLPSRLVPNVEAVTPRLTDAVALYVALGGGWWSAPARG